MDQSRVRDFLNRVSFNLNDSDAQLTYLREELAGTRFSADRDAVAAKLDTLRKDVSAMLRKVEDGGRHRP
jgi:hypothetical protein